MRVCLVEDDPAFYDVVREIIEGMGHSFSVAANCHDALSLTEEPDLYILDVSLPDGSGFDLCDELRKVKRTPILFVTVNDNDDDMVKGFAVGADDYIAKPFKPSLFRARVSALLRRQAWTSKSDGWVDSGHLRIHLTEHILLLNGEEIKLFPSEWKLLNTLIQMGGSLVLRNDILSVFWDSREQFINDNTLSVHMSRLRKKLGLYEGKSYIKTEAYFGYRWNVEISYE